jgi:hypothetical protein
MIEQMIELIRAAPIIVAFGAKGMVPALALFNFSGGLKLDTHR